jgi:hypothetical protein
VWTVCCDIPIHNHPTWGRFETPERAGRSSSSNQGCTIWDAIQSFQDCWHDRRTPTIRTVIFLSKMETTDWVHFCDMWSERQTTLQSCMKFDFCWKLNSPQKSDTFC